MVVLGKHDQQRFVGEEVFDNPGEELPLACFRAQISRLKTCKVKEPAGPIRGRHKKAQGFQCDNLRLIERQFQVDSLRSSAVNHWG